MVWQLQLAMSRGISNRGQVFGSRCNAPHAYGNIKLMCFGSSVSVPCFGCRSALLCYSSRCRVQR